MNINKILHRPAHLTASCRLIGRLFAALSLAATFGTSHANSAPGGELDASFGENGRLTTWVGEINYGRSVAQQPVDGKILVAGYVTSFAPDAFNFAVLRLNPDGSPDNSFGAGGATLVDFGGADDFATEVVLQPDGKIIVAGDADISSIGRGRDFAILRLNADGTIDSTFDGDGRILLDLGGDDETISGVALLPNGQFVVAGTTNANGRHEVAFARFDANGTLDATFGTGQIAGTTLVGAMAKEYTVSAMAWQSDGKYVACGTSDNPGLVTNSNMLAVRVNADGSVDNGFGVGGVATIDTDREFSGAQSCVTMADGTIIMAGFHGEPGNSDLALTRLTSDGRLDTTFGNTGVSSIDLGGIERVNAIILLKDGALAATGITSVYEDGYSQSDMFFIRIDPDSGMLDPTFGNNGVTIVDYGYADLESVASGQSLIQQADGKLLAAGTHVYYWWWATSPEMALARVDPAGAGNAGFVGFKEIFAYVTEGTTEVVVRVRRTGGSVGDLSVDYNAYARNAQEAQSPSDFTAVSGTLNWTSGDMDPKSITIPITDDTIGEGYERFNIALSNSTSTVTLEYVVVGITDNDALPPPPPPPPPTGGNGPGVDNGAGGGGATGIELLILLIMNAAFANRRRSSRYLSVTEKPAFDLHRTAQ